MSNYYAEILIALADADVKFVVAGGVACVLHGVERVTMDVDISLELTDENVSRFVEVAKALNLKPRVPVPIELIVKEENRRKIIEEKNALVFSVVDPDAPYKHIDIFLTEDASYSSLSDGCDIIDLCGRKIQIASKEKIIAMKEVVEPPRDKDLFDIKALRKLLED